MDLTYLIKIVTLIAAISVATERLVEIVKGFSPCLNTENADSAKEGRRRMYLHLLAVAGGIISATLAANGIKSALGIDIMQPIHGESRDASAESPSADKSSVEDIARSPAIMI